MKPDVIVIGSGVAGVSAAFHLKKRGKKVLVVSKSGGATSVSSGAWDFGPIKEEDSLEALRETPAWQELFQKILIDAPELANPADLSASCEALAKDLQMNFNFKRPYCLPSSSGKWKYTFGAQSIQTKANLKDLKNKKIGFVACDRFRFRSDLVLKSLKSWAEAQGTRLDVELLSIDLPSTQSDWPLPHVAARFQNDSTFRTHITQSLAKRLQGHNYDTVLFPPLFLEMDTMELVQKELGVTIAECLSSNEPVAGHRLQKNLERLLQKQEIPIERPSRLHADVTDGRVRKVLEWDSPFVILATGKFFGGGISFGYKNLSEPLLNLPLFVDRTSSKTFRSELDWNPKQFAEEQAWAKLGVWVNSQWAPQQAGKMPALKNVAVAGSLIGGLDFARESVGLGFFAYSGRQCAHVVP